MADDQQILADVAALQAASAAAADQIAELTDQVLALQAGAVTGEQLDNLSAALQAVTSELVAAVEASQAALSGAAATEADEPGR